MPAPSPGCCSTSSVAEAAALAPAEVHAQQHLGPVLRLEAAGAGVDLDDRVAGVVLAAEQPRAARARASSRLDLRRPSARSSRERVGVALLGQLEEDLRLVDALALPLPAVDRAADVRPSRAPTAWARSASFQKSGAAACSLSSAARRSSAGRSKMPPERVDALVERAHALAQLREQPSGRPCCQSLSPCAARTIAEGRERGERRSAHAKTSPKRV